MDFYLFNLINQLAGKSISFDSIGIFLAEKFEYVFLLGLLAFLLFNLKKWKIVVQALIAAILSRFIVIEIIRYVWDRSRPFVDNNINLLIEYPAKASFPSGHTSFYFAIAFIIFFYNKKIGSLFLIGSLLMTVSRVFVGVHWPSDILAGIVIAFLSSWVVYKIAIKAK